MGGNHYHNLLQRQAKKLFGSVENIPPEFEPFVLDVNRAYVEFDNDRSMLERSLELSSQELLQANAEMRGVFHALPDVYFLLNEHGIIRDCKGGTQSDLVVPPEQLIGKTIYRFQNRHVGKLFRNSLHTVMTLQQDVEIEYSLPVGGKTQWYEARMVRLTESKIVVLVRNITVRKNAEQFLEQSYSLLRATLESTADGILVVNNNGEIATYNQQFLSMWKIPPHIIETGMDSVALEFVLNQLKNPELFLQKVGELYAHPDMESFDVLEFKDGRIFERFSKPQIVNGKEAGRVWSFRDVTERKNLEEHLRQSQKLQSVGTLAGGVAHDFNNLLTIILGYSSSLLAKSNVTAPVKEKVVAIKTAAERGALLVRQLLTIARKSEINFESVFINDIVIELISMFGEAFPKTVVFSPTLDQHLPHIIGDYNQIHQAILNICLNARDAVQSNGQISICTKTIRCQDLLPYFPNVHAENYVCIAIADNGQGMDEQTQARVFEPFFSTKEPGKGTGLGLAVAYGIVQSHEGLIRVESKKGAGTTFFLYFPVPSHLPEHIMLNDELMEEIEGNHEGILVVEDETMVRDLMVTTLENKKYNVFSAVDGHEAIEFFDKHKEVIDLIVMDIGLPKLSGWEAYKKIRVQHPTIKIIFASGYVEPELKNEILNGETHMLLQKPYSPFILLREIRNMLDGKE